MGLDITSQKDYFRFNWSGVTGFNNWNEKNNLPNPFPNWNGDNSGDEVDMDNAIDRAKVRKWVKTFEKKFPDLAGMGIGHALRDTQITMVNLKEPGKELTPEQSEIFDRYTALAWYYFLSDKLRTRDGFSYC